MSPQRVRLLFAALVVVQLFLVAGQTSDPVGGANLLQGTLLRALSPLGRLVAGAGELVSGSRAAVRTRRALAAENRELRAEVVELRRQRLRTAGLALEAEELARGLAFLSRARHELRAARVVYFDRASRLAALVIEVGPRGARLDQAVLAESGLVGRVIQTAGAYAKVQLVTDRAAAVAVLLEGAHRQGILRGAGPDRLEIEYVPRQVEVAVGERVVSAGIDGLYPRGMPVGVVEAVEPGTEIFHRIVVRPAVEFDNLSLVYLLERERPPAALTEGRDDAGR